MLRSETASDLISLLNTIDEQEDIEAKTISGADAGKSLYETICALSNEPSLGGGTILLGVAKDEEALFPLYSATGVTDPDKLSTDIQSECSSKFNSPIRVDIKAETVGENVVLRVDVPELPKSHKPAYFKATGLPRGAFRRVGPADVRCNDDDLTTFFVGQSQEAFDTRLVGGADVLDLDPEVLDSYRKARAETSPDEEFLSWSDEDLYHALGAARQVEGIWRPTNAGLVTFGRTASLRRCFPTLRVDYIRVQGNSWVPEADVSYESIDARGSIIRLIPRMMNAILDDLPKTFNIGESLTGQRSETPVIPSKAVREAVVNALMHRSYEGFDPVQIIRYANRLEIRNPGYSLKSQDRFEESGSEIRNPTVAAILHETRFAETKGSGIRIMQRAMAERGLASPTFRSDRDRGEFSVTFLFHHFLNDGDWDWLQSFSEFSLSEEQMKALIFVREVGAIDNSTFRSLNAMDTLTASKALRELREKKLLEQKGAGSAAHYVTGPELASREVSNQARSGSQDSDVVLDGSIQGKGAILDGGIQDKPLAIEDLPMPLRLPTRTASMMQRLDAQRARRVIFELCKWRSLSLEEIALLLNKNKTHVQQQYISSMIADGSLLFTMPKMPKHPQQKYVAGDLVE